MSHQDFKAVADAHRALVSQTADLEPFRSFTEVADIPELSLEDAATVLSYEPDILNDVNLDPATLADILTRGERTTADLGTFLANQLKSAARRGLLSAVQQECWDRAEATREQHLERYYRRSRLTREEQAADQRGVLRLLK